MKQILGLILITMIFSACTRDVEFEYSEKITAEAMESINELDSMDIQYHMVQYGHSYYLVNAEDHKIEYRFNDHNNDETGGLVFLVGIILFLVGLVTGLFSRQ